jgi:poly-gamma-glutamate synthesis protein (capsule biosynthesis protein)
MMAKKEAITFVAIGDFNLNRERPETTFTQSVDLLQSADITFGQLEAAISDRPVPQVHAASICCVPSKNAAGMKYAGIDIISFASNHTMDAGVPALLDTIENARKIGVEVVGAGRDIEEARRPVILERKGTKIGFLAFNSVIPSGYAAGPGKAGCNPIRVTTFYEQIDPQPGTPPVIWTLPNAQDVKVMEDDVRNLKKQVDVVVLSMHWGIHFQPSVIPQYELQVGHAAIDAGADLIIGTHAHILKGIEVYKGKVIFHSLCNFGMDAFLSRQVKTPHAQRLFALYKYQPDPEYTTYPFPFDSRKSIVARAIFEGGKIKKVSYLPVWISKKSEPELLSRSDSRSKEVYEYMEWVCKDQGLETRFVWEGDEVAIPT